MTGRPPREVCYALMAPPGRALNMATRFDRSEEVRLRSGAYFDSYQLGALGKGNILTVRRSLGDIKKIQRRRSENG